MQEKCTTFRYQQTEQIGQLFIDNKKDTEMQLLMYQCLPMQDTLECTDIQELKVVADLA